ncbi:MAG: hypothetical protein JRD89_11940 [Deltaproteobacteria bacterium]|nr:hypothetical protein [Deltaproteobacteria bacterium]
MLIDSTDEGEIIAEVASDLYDIWNLIEEHIQDGEINPHRHIVGGGPTFREAQEQILDTWRLLQKVRDDYVLSGGRWM